jgi:DNA polymerase elongation subunit (family B)
LDGWLFNLYPSSGGGMVVWLVTPQGKPIRLCDRWRPSIYASVRKSSDLSTFLRRKDIPGLEFTVDYKYVNPGDFERTKVLRMTFQRAKDIATFVQNISPTSLIDIRLFNVDVPAAQLYLYEKNLFPLAFVRAHIESDGVRWELLDNAESCQYETPPLRGARITLNVRKSGRIPTFKDPLESIVVTTSGVVSEINCGSETDKLLELVRLIHEIDPDVILTENGDAFVFPYLIQRAFQNQISAQLILDREGTPLQQPRKPGRSYFSYGRIYYRPTPTHLLGRLHLDASNDFIFEDCGLQGLFEIARTCRTPLQRASRETIGTNMTSLQMYQAFRRDILIPWKKNEPEDFKSAWELLKADRGGFILEPKIGLFENVGEIDFASLYPTLMMKYNLTPECISCKCCAHTKTDMRVPELNYNLCDKKIGIVPHTLRILLYKRAQYKTLISKTTDEKLRNIYDQRQAALKWALVCCLTRDSIVPVLVNGQLHLVKIGDFIDGIVGEDEGIFDVDHDVRVVGLGEDLRVKYSPVSRLIKTRAPEKMLDIIMDDGRRICATSNHDFYVLENGRFHVKAGDQLRVGDLIPVSKTLPDPPTTIREIDLIHALLNRVEPSEIDGWRVKGDLLKTAVWQKRKLFYRMGVPYTNVHSWCRSGIIPLRYFQHLPVPQKQHRQLLVGKGRIKGGKITWIPSIIPVDDNLGFFLGLFVVDGSATQSYLRFDIGQNEPELLNYLSNTTWKLFHLRSHIHKERKARMYVAQINCIALVRVLETALGVGLTADRGKLVVPTAILNASQPTILGFISGLVAGDGSVSKTRNFVSIATASESFLNMLSYLLLRIGFQHNLQKSYHNQLTLYQANIVDPLGFVKLTQQGFLKKIHKQRLAIMAKKTCTLNCHHITYETLPVVHSNMRTLAKRLRTVRDPRVDSKANRICPERALRMIQKLRVRKAPQRYPRTYSFLEKVVKADVGFVSVKEINKIHPQKGFVYCFELADSLPGFFAGNGALFTHNSFGYLGYKNARFGKIDAHIGVCAFARKILRETVEIAQEYGFSVVHGIVDSVWLTRSNGDKSNYLDLCEIIEKRLGLPVSFEGLYRWIVFLPSRVNTQLPVLNRYYGVFDNGTTKIRGIEYRRRDAPTIIKNCQREVIEHLASARSSAEFFMLLPSALQLVRNYINRLEQRQVNVRDLLITKQLSKNPIEYRHNVMQAIAAKQLVSEGAQISAGQSVSYILQHEKTGSSVLTSELIDDSAPYDVEGYRQLLLAATAGLLSPFGYDKSRLTALLTNNIPS